MFPLAGWNIAEALNAALVEDLRGKLGRARYFSITADTSTSSGGKDLLDVELHLWTRGKKEVLFGKLVRACTFHLCCPSNVLSRTLRQFYSHSPTPSAHLQVNVDELTNADGQRELLVNVLQKDFELSNDDIASKLVGASFDGALVFQGHLTGVSVQLKVGAATNS